MKIISHEKHQNEAISELRNKVSLLSAEIESYNSIEKIKWSSKDFNYLAIGNSITKHDICDYWWNEVGMAATDEEHDYYHILLKKLQSKYQNVKSYVCNYAQWEIQSNDRSETFNLIDIYLDERIDLITIQLGENATNITTLKSDYISLIKYIKDKAPTAQIIIVGDFWEYENRDNLKEQAALECGVAYASLSEIKDNINYECGLGTIVYDAQNVEHIVEHGGGSAS